MRRVALGDVCAWPARTTQRDGTLLIPNYNGPSHGRVSGDGDCGASVDGGKTWSKRATATPHEPGSATNRMNVAFGMLPNGEATLAACGWSLKQDAVSPSGFEIDQILSMWVCRSSDQGKSWSIDRTSFPHPRPGGWPPVCFRTDPRRTGRRNPPASLYSPKIVRGAEGQPAPGFRISQQGERDRGGREVHLVVRPHRAFH